MGFGAEKENKLIKSVLDEYNSMKFINSDGTLNMTTCPRINTKSIKTYYPKLIRNGSMQIIEEFAFIPCNIHAKLSIHYGDQSWVDNRFKVLNREYKDMWIKDSYVTATNLTI